MMVYKIECYAYLLQYTFFSHFELRSDPEPYPNIFSAEPVPGEKFVPVQKFSP